MFGAFTSQEELDKWHADVKAKRSTEPTICQWCKREAHAVVMIPLDWLNLIEHRGYHDDHVCTARYGGSLTPNVPPHLVWAGVETYRSMAHEMARPTGFGQ